MEFGFLSVLPAIVAITLAIATREVIGSLFIAIVLGATFLNNYNPGTGLLQAMDNYVLGSVTDEWNCAILIFTLLMGGMIGLITRSGGANAIAESLAKRAKTPRAGQLYTWLIGMLIFFDDYGSSLITGNTARPLTDRLRISREKLSYIVDSTAAPVATIGIISTWIGYELGIIRDSFMKVGIEENVFFLFLKSIPFRYYSIFALGLVVIVSVLMRDFGPMYTAEKRARTTGKVLRDGAVPLVDTAAKDLMVKEGAPLRVINFLLPIIVLVGATFYGLYWDGVHNGGATAGKLLEAIGEADASVVLLWTSMIGAIVALVLVLAQRILAFNEAMDTLVSGMKSVFFACIILVLAWSISAVSSELGAAEYLVGLVTSGGVPYQIIPLLIFLIACLMSFATGTSWGTMGIILPLAIPVAYALNDAILIPTMGAVLTGAIFGDHCSPISDSTILSSTGSGADHIDHVRTQMPYALLAAAVAAVFGFIPAGFGMPYWTTLISIVVGWIVLIVFVRLVGKSTASEADIVEAGKADVRA